MTPSPECECGHYPVFHTDLKGPCFILGGRCPCMAFTPRPSPAVADARKAFKPVGPIEVIDGVEQARDVIEGLYAQGSAMSEALGACRMRLRSVTAAARELRKALCDTSCLLHDQRRRCNCWGKMSGPCPNCRSIGKTVDTGSALIKDTAFLDGGEGEG